MISIMPVSLLAVRLRGRHTTSYSKNARCARLPPIAIWKQALTTVGNMNSKQITREPPVQLFCWVASPTL